MDASIAQRLAEIRAQFYTHLTQGIMPFWATRALDAEQGGYFTCFDADGRLDTTDSDKHLVMQGRMVWSFARFSRFVADHDLADMPDFTALARHGVDFLIDHFWDAEFGGWYWQVTRDGALVDDSKVVYGQSFALYGLAEYARATGDPRGLDYAGRTFDVLLRGASDLVRGGFYQSFSRDWALAPSPIHGESFMDRKTLNTTMHLMEALITLLAAVDRPVYRHRLAELVETIIQRVLYAETGVGPEWNELDFRPIPADEVRQWQPDSRRFAHVALPAPAYLTSYGHNIELAWLLVEAGEALGLPRDAYLDTVRRLADHTLIHGLDAIQGGIYNVGDHLGPVYDGTKGWWQNAEALVGFLEAYLLTGEERYLHAVINVWDFSRGYLINESLGEWHSDVAADGTPVMAALGHSWKSAYHTGRAMIEALHRLDMMGVT